MPVGMLNPFGVPDGTPQDGADDPLKDFVRVSGRQFRAGLGMDANDRRVRVIVGRKGAGKTLYLRRLQKAARAEGSLYADSWQIDHPPTNLVIRLFGLSNKAVVASERWERVWRIALLRSAASHLLCAPTLRPSIAAIVPRLELILSELQCKFTAPSPPSHQVEEILYGIDHGPALDEYLDNPAWRRFEEAMKAAFDAARPICMYLDALDDHFEQAPRQWLACQKGLCQTVLRMTDQFPRFHVVITVRDIVYSAVCASEHMMKYKGTDRIRTLDWNKDAIELLLQTKIEALPEEYLLGKPNADTPVQRWLGMNEIKNAGRSPARANRLELLKVYLLRHSRLIPRDLIHLGNALCLEIDRVLDDKEPVLLPRNVHAAVKRIAREAGREELLIIANHITTTWLPLRGVDAEASGLAANLKEIGEEGRTLQHEVRNHLRRLLHELETDRLTQRQLKDFQVSTRADFGEVDVCSLLWQHGMLGYIEDDLLEGDPVFYSALNGDEMYLETDHPAYALHPIMIDAVPVRGHGGIVTGF